MADLQILEKLNTPIDAMIQFIAKQNPDLTRYYEPNNALKGFNSVTLPLVERFRNDAYSHIKHILDNLSKYGSLYDISYRRDLFNTMDVNYVDFPLLTGKQVVLKVIEKMAADFFSRHSLQFKITCVYLLYFYALLVNPKRNWNTIDYISYGNRNHQYLVN